MRRSSDARQADYRAGFGVDFGRRLLKAILVEDSFEGVVVRAAATSPVSPGCFMGDVIGERKKVAALLKSLCASQGILPRRGRFSVPTSALNLRWVDLPPVDDVDLQDVAAFQARRYFPSAEGGSYQTLTRLTGASEGDAAHYLLVSAPKDVVDSRALVMEAAGIEPVAADIEPLCVLRALQGLFSHGGVFWRNQSLTFVEMGSHSTQMYVVRDMALRFVRAIPIGGRNVALKVAEHRGCTEAQAADWVEGPTSAITIDGMLRVGPDGERQELSVDSVLAPMIREIHRLLIYYRSLFPERSYAGILDRVYLCGGMASLRGMEQVLAHQLGVSIHLVNPFSQALAKFNINAFESVSHREHAFTGTMGLATADLMDAPLGEGAIYSDSSDFLWTRPA